MNNVTGKYLVVVCALTSIIPMRRTIKRVVLMGCSMLFMGLVFVFANVLMRQMRSMRENRSAIDTQSRTEPGANFTFIGSFLKVNKDQLDFEMEKTIFYWMTNLIKFAQQRKPSPSLPLQLPVPASAPAPATYTINPTKYNDKDANLKLSNSINNTTQKMSACVLFPNERLSGPLRVNISAGLENLRMLNLGVNRGGRWKPRHCYSEHRVAIIVPYRNRRAHLGTLLYHLHPILQRQLLDYQIFVVEQTGNETFNKGVLMNAGVIEALKERPFDCFVFHDVDLIPENDRNLYSCPCVPRHMSVAINKFNYMLPYSYLIGGVFAISKAHLILVNGYSNLYWGWGGEDDDMAFRLEQNNLQIMRPSESVGRYTMLNHSPRPESPEEARSFLLWRAKRRFAKHEGLNSVRYKVVQRRAEPFFTYFVVSPQNVRKFNFSLSLRSHYRGHQNDFLGLD